MKWIKLTMDTTTEAVDYISALLDELGIEGIEIEDHIPITEDEKKKMFIDMLPDMGPDDGKAQISFYLDQGVEPLAVLNQIREGMQEFADFVEIGSGNFTISETEDADWINNWKQYFKPFRVDDSIVIKPTWEKLTETREKDLVIELDPGTAFGTGAHETTKLCIIHIKKYLKAGDSLLDLGCGSGILSIVADRLGAGKVTGTDIDPNAVNIAAENTCINGIHVSKEKFEAGAVSFFTGNVIDDQEFRRKIGHNCYQVVVANILADIIIPLAKVVGDHLTENGIFISSGIINTKAEEVKAAILSNGFCIEEFTTMGDWVSIVAVKDNSKIEWDRTVIIQSN